MSPDDDRLAWDGLVALIRDGDWWQPWRLPPDRVETAHAPDLAIRARMPAGVRFAVRTDAVRVAIVLDGDAESAPVDVLVEGKRTQRLAVVPGHSVVEAILPPGLKSMELWLPHVGQTRIGVLTFTGQTDIVPAPSGGPRWITYGSSITQCRTANGPSETWPAVVTRQYAWRLTCLGFGGECHLDPVVARTIRDATADLITLCLGINVYELATFSPRTFASAVSGFIETVRDGHPDVPLAVITPIASPDRERRQNLVGMTLEDVRNGVVAAVETLAQLGDENLHLIDGRELLGAHEGNLLHDGLHPSADGYRAIATRIAPRLERALRNQPP